MRRYDLLKIVGGFNVIQKRQVPKSKAFLCRVARSLPDNHKKSLAKWICGGFADSKESEKEKTLLLPLEMLLSAFLRHSRLIQSEGLYMNVYKTASDNTCSQVMKFVGNNYNSEYQTSFSKAMDICNKFKNCFKPLLTELDPNQQLVNVRAQITELTRDIDLDKMEKKSDYVMIEAEVFEFISRIVCRGTTELACIRPTVFYNHIKTDKEAVNEYLQMHIHPDWKILYIPYLCRCPDNHPPFHWVLFIVDRSDHQVFFYDTLRKECNEKMRNDLSRILDELRDDDIPWNDPITVVDCVTQTNNTSCGYWVCCLAWGHALGTLHEVYKLTSEQVRQEVIIKLAESKNEDYVSDTNADGQIEPTVPPVTNQTSTKPKED